MISKSQIDKLVDDTMYKIDAKLSVSVIGEYYSMPLRPYQVQRIREAIYSLVESYAVFPVKLNEDEPTYVNTDTSTLIDKAFDTLGEDKLVEIAEQVEESIPVKHTCKAQNCAAPNCYEGHEPKGCLMEGAHDNQDSWIAIDSERQPNHKDMVFVADNFFVFSAYYDKIKGAWFAYTEKGLTKVYGITHWQAQPSNPKK